MVVVARVRVESQSLLISPGPLTNRPQLCLVFTPQGNAMLSHVDIYRAAHLMMHEHGDDAELEAATHADRVFRRGDRASCSPDSEYGQRLL